jgi:SAM-dependent methyltransferase
VVGLKSKPCTQRDVESAWFSTWCRALKIPENFHRKCWEYAFVLQALHEHGKLAPGSTALGFACGSEPLASYFASRGVAAVVTDQPPDRAASEGWTQTGQHATSLENVFKPALVDRPAFDRFVRLEYVDMNAIPVKYDGAYDFCWSVCAMEHLGNIDNGLRFVEEAMKALKPGGLAIHTTEFAYGSEKDTLERGPSVLFLKRHLLELRDRLLAAGHEMDPPEFDVGHGVFDQYVDLPPYEVPEPWGTSPAHLKMAVGGHRSTCFGLVVRKRP